ncbi:MAG: DUF6178 family protein, partial [Candidatus Binatia bacterium]
FGSVADLDRARALVVDVGWLPTLCERLLGQPLEKIATLRPAQADEFRLSAVFLTALAQLALGRTASVLPLAAGDLNELRARTIHPAGRTLRAEIRDTWLRKIGPEGGRFLDFCCDRFENEFLSIADAEIDSRFVTCLMLEL